MRRDRLGKAALTALIGLSLVAPSPAAANGAASTRNIIFGAAAAGGTLLIINHNKKVHQKYAEYDQRQAQTQSEANQAQAAYESEKQAYAHEAAMVGEYRKEIAYEHKAVHERDVQIASLERSLLVAKASRRASTATAFVQPPAGRAASAQHAPARRSLALNRTQRAPEVVSYGWGTF